MWHLELLDLIIVGISVFSIGSKKSLMKFYFRSSKNHSLTLIWFLLEYTSLTWNKKAKSFFLFWKIAKSFRLAELVNIFIVIALRFSIPKILLVLKYLSLFRSCSKSTDMNTKSNTEWFLYVSRDFLGKVQNIKQWSAVRARNPIPS